MNSPFRPLSARCLQEYEGSVTGHSRGHVSRVTCHVSGVGTHSVLTPSSVAPALGQGWVRTEPGHPPSPAQPEQHAASSSCWSARAGLDWAGQLGPVTAAAVMIYCHASPLAFLLFSPPTTSEQLHLLNSHLSDRGDLQTYILPFTLQTSLTL